MGILSLFTGGSDKGLDVYIGNLHPKARPGDLEAFFKGFTKNTRFKIVTKYYNDGSSHRFGIVTFESEVLGRKAISKLHLKQLMGKPVEVREYFHRTYQNERRELGWRNKQWEGEDRRGQERRRKEVEKPEEESVSISGYKELAKKNL